MIDLRELVSDPRRATALSAEEAMAVLVELAAVQTAIASHLRASAPATEVQTMVAPHEDRLLTPTEAAAHLAVSVRWLYRNFDQLPFSRRLTRRTLRFSEAGIARYLAQRRR